MGFDTLARILIGYLFAFVAVRLRCYYYCEVAETWNFVKLVCCDIPRGTSGEKVEGNIVKIESTQRQPRIE